ncbi:gamma-glutamyltransferase 1 Threonine peptidase. MEROPS family T03 [Sphingomonas laterariae]|uniref:Glutathione hydrolase proenzyme n=1 Tax=Edaphosphingomonas laterariae TaxID=861865 RepID=A0A239F3J4_9SPHN|nr:gamma-glutamyltransferase [Sphingomonas laterariae]SNS51590.1 gamma-glutamyltransferase 1 Threonine peptidase. MEROPS family T03 [Sphingomonas laterariae]
MVARLCLLLALILTPIAANAAGGVVTAADPRAAEAGRQMLRAGGSATDAAMAMMLALTVVEPQSSGIGGGGLLVHHDGGTGTLSTIDGREAAPAAATADRFMANGKAMAYGQAFPGGKSVGVPGNIRLMADAHRKWGKLPWAKLFEPAIRLAENGYAVSPRMARFMGYVSPLWQDFPEIAALYTRDGKAAPAGTIIRNPALAGLLRDIATGGPDAFYAGRHGAAIAAAVTNAPRHPVPLTLADLAAYQAKERAPVCGEYRGYRVCGMGPPSSGGVTILQMLGMIERFDMAKLGKDSPTAWHLIGEAMQLAYADRETYLGDVDFVSVPLAGLIDRNYLAKRSALISPVRSLGRYQPGTPPGAEPRTAGISGEVSGTTHFVAVDGNGDVVSMTSTVEGPFGSQLVASGMVLNNELTDFTFVPERNGAPVANRVEAGKRPLSSMSPTIVYGPDGKVVLALGSAGGKRIIMHVMKALVGFIDWKLPAAEAIALPNIYFGGGALQVEQGTSLDAMRPALEKLGQPVSPADLASKLNAVERVGNGWRGTADTRSEGVALTE